MSKWVNDQNIETDSIHSHKHPAAAGPREKKKYMKSRVALFFHQQRNRGCVYLCLPLHNTQKEIKADKKKKSDNK
jgi:hypothetical protein